MAEAVFMPKQGQSVESCIITQWYKKKGEKIEVGDLLFAYETDKAAFEEEARHDGILLEIFFNEGDEVPVLSNVAVIGKKGESVEEFRKLSGQENIVESPTQMETKPVQVIEEIKDSEIIRVSPRAKKMAEEKGVDLKSLSGTGPNGRIIVRDIENLTPSASGISQQKVEYKSGADSETKPLSNIRKIIARNMLASLQNSAQLTHHLGADARKMLSLRKDIKERASHENIPNITLNDMVCYAVIRTLLKHPDINSHFGGETITRFFKVHLGIAVDTERGLMVPVLRNADDYSLRGLSVQLKNLADACRNGKIDPGLLQSDAGSFTVSNLGAYGIELFTPVINLPQTGILGINTITYRPADTGDGTISFIPAIGLSLTYDHRAIDGAPASAFLKDLKLYIENFNNNSI